MFAVRKLHGKKSNVYYFLFLTTRDVEVGYDPEACDHMIDSMQCQETIAGDQSNTTVKKTLPLVTAYVVIGQLDMNK